MLLHNILNHKINRNRLEIFEQLVKNAEICGSAEKLQACIKLFRKSHPKQQIQKMLWRINLSKISFT